MTADATAGRRYAPASPAQLSRTLVYSPDPAVRERIRRCIGSRPASDVAVEFIDAGDQDAVVRVADAGDADLLILDGEAWPVGGMGICRQLKAEIRNCPPVLLIIARTDDAWLAHWSGADRTLAYPLDPAVVARTVADLLRDRSAGGASAVVPN